MLQLRSNNGYLLQILKLSPIESSGIFAKGYFAAILLPRQIFDSTNFKIKMSPVSSEISDFTSCAHPQSNILQTKYAEKTDD